MTEKDRQWWDRLAEAALAGKAVQVTLTKDMEIKRRRRPSGTQRVRGQQRFSHYAAFIGTRPHCPYPRCGRCLRRDQPVACCAWHEQRVEKLGKRSKGAR